MQSELIYQLALTRVSNIGCIHAKTLVQHFGSASAIFRAPKSSLEKIEGIGTVRANNIKQYSSFNEDENEIAFIRKFGIQPLFITDPKYPQRLIHHCYDAPVLLFYRGTANLNSSKMIAVVGTRNNSDYGRAFTEKLIKDLVQHEVVIVSGLAFGIDAVAHKAALRNNLSTIGVVGHGLDYIYPANHTVLAKEMVKQNGGILTEFRSGTKPDKHNFPGRNRIVAGLTDATVVVETGIKGGSMITAELANGYNRDVFALPGRTTDHKSEGCNQLIKTNKAVLLTDSAQLIDLMGWGEKPIIARKQQKIIFENLSEHEKIVLKILQDCESVHIDEIMLRAKVNGSAIAAAILNLEIENIVRGLPGKRYSLT